MKRFTAADWDKWSRADDAIIPVNVNQNGVHLMEPNSVAGGTIYQMAKERGYRLALLPLPF